MGKTLVGVGFSLRGWGGVGTLLPKKAVRVQTGTCDREQPTRKLKLAATTSPPPIPPAVYAHAKSDELRYSGRRQPLKSPGRHEAAPSTGIAVPVMYPASRLARKAASLPISSG